jgi:dihydrodiol dehydrogenase / D-xylose 1-dehydrogenase (NADP)
MENIRWGILGPGNIARSFAQGLSVLDDAEIVAVGSRSAERAAAFGEQYGVPRRYTSYEALANDPDVDVVYVATPHPFHKEHSLLCLRAGKPVLCEKPFTLNAADTAAVIALARERRLFLMEAIWTRFLPHIVKLRELIAEGAIGEVRQVRADFSFRAEVDPKSRLFDPTLGGGGLLDVGIYPVSLAAMLLGAPSDIASLAQLGTTGVDEQAGIVMRYDGGRLAVLTTAIRTSSPHEALILGTTGQIKVHDAWWKPSTLTLARDGRAAQPIDVSAVGNGYNYEAAEVMRCLRAGRTESATMPLDESLAIMRTLDAIRAQWGLRYPGE